jgi:glycosyltransferase involved in cell wall biosynthesis
MDVLLCVDALEPQLSGIGRYTWELCKGLAQHEGISSLSYLAGSALVKDPATLMLPKRLRSRRRIWPARLLRRWESERALRTKLVHGPNYFLPAHAETGIITVHDLSVFLYPETHPPSRVRAFEKLFGSSLRRAAHIITDTETVRRELVETCSVDARMVTAVPLGVDPRFKPRSREEIAAVLNRWRLRPGAYGLSVSTFEPRKKIANLIAAWRRLPASLRQGFPLVLAGATGWQNEKLHEQILNGEAEGWLRHLGFVTDSALPELYAGAALFLYPSVYEGFGLPPIEAMASGVPTVVSDRSCLPEVCGNAARYVDPDDEEGFTSLIEDALSDPKWRSDAMQLGLKHVQAFTWGRCVEGTVSVYRSVAAPK